MPKIEDYRQRYYQSYVTSMAGSISPTYNGIKSRSYLAEWIISRLFPKDKQISIFEIGCGHGAFIHSAKNAGYSNIKGVDNSEQQVSAAKKLGIEEVFYGDAFKYLSDEEDESFDVIVAIDVVEHLTHEELLNLTDTVYKKLKIKGKFILHTPNATSIFSGRMRYGDLTHQLAFTGKSIGQLSSVAGFSGVQCFEAGPFAHGFVSLMRKILWQAVRCLLKLFMTIETGSSDDYFTENIIAVATK